MCIVYDMHLRYTLYTYVYTLTVYIDYLQSNMCLMYIVLVDMYYLVFLYVCMIVVRG